MDLLTQVLAGALDDQDDDYQYDQDYDDSDDDDCDYEEEDHEENEDGESEINPPRESSRQSYFAFAGFQKQFACWHSEKVTNMGIISDSCVDILRKPQSQHSLQDLPRAPYGSTQGILLFLKALTAPRLRMIIGNDDEYNEFLLARFWLWTYWHIWEIFDGVYPMSLGVLV